MKGRPEGLLVKTNRMSCRPSRLRSGSDVVQTFRVCDQGEKNCTGCPENKTPDQEVDLQCVQHGSVLLVSELATESINDEEKTCSQESREKNEKRNRFIRHVHLRIEQRCKCNGDTK